MEQVRDAENVEQNDRSGGGRVDGKTAGGGNGGIRSGAEILDWKTENDRITGGAERQEVEDLL